MNMAEHRFLNVGWAALRRVRDALESCGVTALLIQPRMTPIHADGSDPRACAIRLSLLAFLFLWFAFAASAATFTNNASIKVDDPNNALTSTSGVFTVSCWFRIAIPSSFTLNEPMLILMDRSDGNESANHSFLLRLNTAAEVEFVTHGSGGSFTKTIIQRPYLERWYHVAVTRDGSTFSTYVDGQLVIGTPESGTTAVGTTTGSGLAIGGVNGTSKLFYGDIVVLQSKTPLCALSLRLFAFRKKAKHEQATAAAFQCRRESQNPAAAFAGRQSGFSPVRAARDSTEPVLYLAEAVL